MPAPNEIVEELVFQCLEQLAAGGSDAVDELLASQPDGVQLQVRETMSTLARVGLAGESVDAPGDPQQLGPYRLLERLGSGAMGVVYRARTLDDEVELAVKLMQPGLMPSRGSRQRFEREITALRELDHPGICPIVDDGESDGVPFLAMPFVPGPSLRELIDEGSADSRDRVLGALQQIAEALHHAHGRGFVHRDVKPGNVILRPDGQAVLLDFGLARLDRSFVDGTLTASGGVVGTPAYMAPEQVAGRADVDRRCDVYAVGAMLYEVLTGVLPHEAPTRESLYRRILAGDVPRPSTRGVGLADSHDAVCLMALAREPERRYRTAEHLAADIGCLRAGTRPAARLPGPLLRLRAWCSRYPVASVLVVLLTIAAVGVGVLAWSVHRSAISHRARSMAADAQQRMWGDANAALADALSAHDLEPVPEALVAIQSALKFDHTRVTLPPLDDAVTAIRFSPDDRWLFAKSADEIAVFDLQGQAAAPPRLIVPAAAAAEFQPGSDAPVRLAVALRDGLVALEVASGRELWRRDGLSSGPEIDALLYSPGGSRLLLGAERRVSVVMSETGDTQASMAIDSRLVAACWLDETRFCLARALGSGQFRLSAFEVRDRKLVRLEEREIDVPVLALRSNPVTDRGEQLLVVADAKHGAIWDVGSDGWTRIEPSRKFTNRVVAGGWSPDGARVFLAARGGRAQVFMASGRPLRADSGLEEATHGMANPVFSDFAVIGDYGVVSLHSFRGHVVRHFGRRRLRDGPIAYSHDGRWLAASTWGHRIQVFRLHDPELPLLSFGGRVRSATWNAAEDGVITSMDDGRSRGRAGILSDWDLATGREVQRGPEPRLLGIQDLQLDKSKTRVVVAQISKGETYVNLLARRGDDWEVRAELPDDAIGTANLARFCGSDTVLIGDRSGRLVIWDLAAGTTSSLPHDGALAANPDVYDQWRAIAFFDEGETIWVGGDPGYLHRFDRLDAGRYRESKPIWLRDSILVLSALPDRSLMIGGTNGMLVRMDEHGRRIEFRRHRSKVRCIDSAELDGELLIASGDGLGTICLWRSDGTLVREIDAHSDVVFALEFSTDGSRLLSCSRNNKARVWPVRTRDLLDLARRRLR